MSSTGVYKMEFIKTSGNLNGHSLQLVRDTVSGRNMQERGKKSFKMGLVLEDLLNGTE